LDGGFRPINGKLEIFVGENVIFAMKAQGAYLKVLWLFSKLGRLIAQFSLAQEV